MPSSRPGSVAKGRGDHNLKRRSTPSVVYSFDSGEGGDFGGAEGHGGYGGEGGRGGGLEGGKGNVEAGGKALPAWSGWRTQNQLR